MKKQNKQARVTLRTIFGFLIVTTLFLFPFVLGQLDTEEPDPIIEPDLITEVELISQTADSDTFRLSDGSSKTDLYSGVRNVFEDGVWKKIEDARSLKDKGFIIKLIESDEIHELELIDLNYTSLTINITIPEKLFEDVREVDVPYKVWRFNNTKSNDAIIKETYKDFYTIIESGTITFSKPTIERTFTMGLNDVIEIGKNSAASKVLSDSTGVYDGSIRKDTSTIFTRYDKDNNFAAEHGSWVGFKDWILIGEDFDPVRSFVEVNTSSIPDGVGVSKIEFNVSVINAYGSGDTVDITRFQNKQVSDTSNYPNTNAGNEDLYNDIGTGIGGTYRTGLTGFQTTGEKKFTLGSTANGDLEVQLVNDFFAVGLVGSDETSDDMQIRHSVDFGFEGPRLTVFYDACVPPANNDWLINVSCILVSEDFTITNDNNIFIQNKGFLSLTVGSNITFSGTGQFINMTGTGSADSRLNISKGSNINP